MEALVTKLPGKQLDCVLQHFYRCGQPHQHCSTATLQGVEVVRLGGHFPGSCVLQWRDGCEGRGALFTGALALRALAAVGVWLHSL